MNSLEIMEEAAPDWAERNGAGKWSLRICFVWELGTRAEPMGLVYVWSEVLRGLGNTGICYASSAMDELKVDKE